MSVPLKQGKEFKKKKQNNWLIFNATSFTKTDGV